MARQTQFSPYIPVVALVFTAAVIVAVLYPDGSLTGGQQQVLRVLSPARARALELTLELHTEARRGDGWHPQVLSTAGRDSAVAPGVVHEGDRLRLALAAELSSGWYVYAVGPSREPVRIPDVAAGPLRATRGDVLWVPSGDAWFSIGPPYGSWSVLILASRERLGDLEDLDLRYRQSEGELRRALGDSMLSALHDNAVAEFSYTVAE